MKPELISQDSIKQISLSLIDHFYHIKDDLLLKESFDKILDVLLKN